MDGYKQIVNKPGRNRESFSPEDTTRAPIRKREDSVLREKYRKLSQGGRE